MKTGLEKLIEKWESEMGSYIPNENIYRAFINDAKNQLQKDKIYKYTFYCKDDCIKNATECYEDFIPCKKQCNKCKQNA